jgi:uncharacterized damage-inducible protein DinB
MGEAAGDRRLNVAVGSRLLERQTSKLATGDFMKKFFLLMILFTATLHAQYEGLWEGYNGEWSHVSKQLIALAEATPADKFSWRPAPGVRSTSEVYMHIAVANFYLLSVTGSPMPSEIKASETEDQIERSLTSKADVIAFLKRSLDAVRTARAQLKPGDLQRKVRIMDKDATVDGMYLRILVHDNEHMGQLIAYARMSGVVPPWSK